ncbi:MAG: SIR2 family NAD-dependent protein deacylase [Peptococcaceae bacterium]
MQYAERLQTLAEWLKQSPYTVVFTGAGMSTEAGLPDFRSKDGLWKQKDPRKLASLEAMQQNPEEFYEFYRMRLATLGLADPHQGHYLLAQWEKERKIRAVITQNVDGLHHKAGSNRVIELHGTLREAVCLKCKAVFPAGVLMGQGIPRCRCGSMLKPGVILFGEMLPQDALHQADIESRRSHLFIVIGSSLEVSPANYFPLQAREAGAKLVIINMEKTIMDEEADLIIPGKAGEVLAEINGLLQQEK